MTEEEAARERIRIAKWAKKRGYKKMCECCNECPVVPEIYIDPIGSICLKRKEGWEPVRMRKLCPVCWMLGGETEHRMSLEELLDNDDKTAVGSPLKALRMVIRGRKSGNR